MASGIDSAPSIYPHREVSAPMHSIEGASEGSVEPPRAADMAETGDESADVASMTLPVDTPAAPMDSRSLRKRVCTEISGQNHFQGPNGTYLAACEYFRLCCIHRSYPLQRWATECGLPRTTLAYQVGKLTETERENLLSIGRMEAEKQRTEVKAKSREEIWEEKRAQREQVGQRALYLDSGVPFQNYQEAYAWGVKQIVASKMTPTVASRAISERFGAQIRQSTTCAA